MIKRGLTLVNAMQCTVLPHITASVFINHEAGASTGGTTAPARTPVGTGDRGLPQASLADAHLKRNATRQVARHGPRRAAVVGVTNGRLDGSAELAEFFGTWERIFYGEFDGRRKRVLVKIIRE